MSAPLEWEEVPAVEPEVFTIETMRDRIAAAGDPMQGMWRRGVSLRSRFGSSGSTRPPDFVTKS